MKYGSGELEDNVSDVFFSILKDDGIVVFKNLRLKERVKNFIRYDYMIQDLGFQPDGFKLTVPKARPNHAFWMIWKKDV